MKKLLLAFLLLGSISTLEAQILKPVKWSYAAKRTSATEAIISFKATIDEGWHLYSQNMADEGPTKTVFKFATSPQFTLNGTTAESKPIEKFEKLFNMNVKYFEKQAIFQQKVKLKSNKPLVVKGTIYFGACDDTTCIPPEELSFAVNVK